MRRPWKCLVTIGLVGLSLAVAGCDGNDGATGPQGPEGPEGPQGPIGPEGPPAASVIDLQTAPPEYVESLDVVTEVTDVTISSPPVVTFTLKTASGVPIIGLVPFWEDDARFVRFTLTKLVPGTNGDPDSWVAYVRRSTGSPNYDSGSQLVDNGNGTYEFTFATDVTAVAGVPYEPSLTHRVAGQIGSSSVALPAQNVWWDFVPAGGAVTRTRNIADVTSCNECHDRLTMHGRRFLVQYCVQCHNPDLGGGEANLSFMIHRIHAAGVFEDLGDFSEVTFPQDLENCRKCHNGADAATPEGDNWKNKPNQAACGGCHDIDFNSNEHNNNPQPDNSLCNLCHTPAAIENHHLTTNATPNNPNLPTGERNIQYELNSATYVDGDLVIQFRILSDGTALDVTNLPADLAGPGRYPGFLLAWAESQDGIAEPVDFNNYGDSAAQPISVGIDALDDLTFDAGTGVLTGTIFGDPYPEGAGMRTVGLQGYFQQQVGLDTISLHTPAKVVTLDGDTGRRQIVDSAKCGQCHEWFEGHGGNRVYNISICQMCHVPNLSSSGRTIELGSPEDAQNLKDMVHGIHSSGFRTTDFEHVRNFRNSANYYNWSEVTFPAERGTANCLLCHDDFPELPLPEGVLPTTVRTTGVEDGQDATTGDYAAARDNVPNDTDWVNTPTGSSCFYCHDSLYAMAHMMQNGAQLSKPDGFFFTNRFDLGNGFEACSVCHGPGRIASLETVHGE